MLSNDPVKVSWEHLISDQPRSEQNLVSDAVAESSPLCWACLRVQEAGSGSSLVDATAWRSGRGGERRPGKQPLKSC